MTVGSVLMLIFGVGIGFGVSLGVVSFRRIRAEWKKADDL